MQVLSFNPQGEAHAQRALVVTFDRPMMSGIDARDPSPPQRQARQRYGESLLEVSPGRSGTVRWHGPQVLSFLPEGGAWPLASPWTAALVEEARALTGERVDDPPLWTFNTPRPELIRAEPSFSTYYAATDAALILRFNQPVDLSTLSQRLTLTADREPIAFKLRYKPEDPSTWPSHEVEIVTKGPLPANARIEITVQSGVQGVEGLLPSRRTLRLVHQTHGPLMVTDAHCAIQGACPIDQPLTIDFNHPLPEDAAQHFTLTPTPAHAPRFEIRDKVVQIHARWPPASQITVQATRTLRDVFGNSLSRKWQTTLRTGPAAPAAAFEGGYAEGARQLTALPADRQTLAAQLINIKRARFQISPVSTRQLGDVWRHFVNPDLKAPPISPGRPQTTRVQSDANARHRWTLPLDALQRSSVAWLAVEASPDRATTRHPGPLRRVALVQRSDQRLQLWASDAQTTLRVTHARRGEPLQGVTLRLLDARGATRWTGQADDEGFAAAPALSTLPGPRPMFAVAGQDPDIAFLPLDEASRLAIWPTNDWALTETTTPGPTDMERGLLFVPSGAHPPGARLSVAGLLTVENTRSGARRSHSAQQRAHLTLRDERGVVVKRTTTSMTPDGALATSLTLPENIHEGLYTLHLSLTRAPDSARGGDAGLSAVVEVGPQREAQAPSLQMALADRHLMAGQQLTARLHARRAHGAPFSGAPVQWSLQAQRAPFSSPFTHEPLGSLETPQDSKRLDGQTQLGPDGTLSLDVPIDAAWGMATHKLTLNVIVETDAGQSLRATGEAWLHPAEIVVDVAQGTRVVRAQAPISPRLRVTTPEGYVRVNVPITLHLERRSEDGQWRPTSRCRVKSADGEASCVVKATASGPHRLRAEAKDRLGHLTTTIVPLEVTGADPPRADVSLTLDRDEVAPGEAATLLIRTPYDDARATLLIARRGALAHRALGVVGREATVKLPAEEDDAPGLRVLVTITAQGDAQAPWSTRREVTLAVTPPALRVSLDASAPARPDQPWTGRVTVVNERGEPVEADVLLSVNARHDSGLDDTTPPLNDAALESFWRWSPPSLLVMDTQTFMGSGQAEARLGSASASELTPEAQAGPSQEGAGGGLMVGPVRSDAQEGQRRHGPVTLIRTDLKGVASFGLGDVDAGDRVVLRALASVDGKRFGAGAWTQDAAHGLSLTPMASAVLRRGDRIQGGVWVTNDGDDEAQVRVRATTTSDSPLELEGDDERVLTLAPGERALASMTWRGVGAGVGELQFEATREDRRGQAARAQTTLRVEAAGREIRIARHGQTQGAFSQALTLPAAWSETRGGLWISLSADPRLILADPMARVLLTEAPGTTSVAWQLVARLVSADLLRDQILPGRPSVRPLKVLLEQLLAAQGDDGGFSDGPDAQEMSVEATTAALHGLRAAQAMRLSVPEEALNAALDAGERMLHRRETPDRRSLEPDMSATLAAALAMLDPGRVRLEQDLGALAARGATLSPLGRAWLALAFEARLRSVRQRDPGRRQLDALSEALKTHRGGLDALDARTLAVSLWAFLRLDEDHPQRHALRGALVARHARSAPVTAEGAAWSLVSLRGAFQGEPPRRSLDEARIWLDGQYMGGRRFGRSKARFRHVWIPARMLRPGLEQELILSAQRGTLHFRLALRGETAQGAGGDPAANITRSHHDGDTGAVMDFAEALSAGQLIETRILLAAASEASGAWLSVPTPAGSTLLGCSALPNGVYPAAKLHQIVHEAGGWVVQLRELSAGVHQMACRWRPGIRGELALPPASLQVHGLNPTWSASERVRVE